MTMRVATSEVVNFGKFYCIPCAVKSYCTFFEPQKAHFLTLLNIQYPRDYNLHLIENKLLLQFYVLLPRMDVPPIDKFSK